jgi:Cu/Ag efflux pump CusA
MIPLSRISDFWSPLAYAIMYGLTFAMILTLIFIPALFYRAEKRKRDGTHGVISTVFRFLWRTLTGALTRITQR